jgi:transcriptional regulator with XRE-family HTH domain
MGNLREIVARNVQERMKASPLVRTQPLLAKKAGIGQSHVSRIVNAAAGVTIDRLEMVARALGCEPYELLIEDETARRALIERLMSGPHVPTERVEQAGFVPMPNHDDGHPDVLADPHRSEKDKSWRRTYSSDARPPANLKPIKAGKKKE